MHNMNESRLDQAGAEFTTLWGRFQSGLSIKFTVLYAARVRSKTGSGFFSTDLKAMQRDYFSLSDPNFTDFKKAILSETDFWIKKIEEYKSYRAAVERKLKSQGFKDRVDAGILPYREFANGEAVGAELLRRVRSPYTSESTRTHLCYFLCLADMFWDISQKDLPEAHKYTSLVGYS